MRSKAPTMHICWSCKYCAARSGGIALEWPHAMLRAYRYVNDIFYSRCKRSAAASSVWSRLAKQNRITR
jgi:hypothetical protein